MTTSNQPTTPAATTTTTTTTTTAPAPVHRNFLETIGHDIEVGVIDAEKFITQLPKMISAWNKLAPQVKAVALQIFHDVMTAANDVAQAVGDAKALNIPGAISLSEQTWTAIMQLVTDAKADEAEIVASLKVLGITV
jgi:hypothetical protein